MRAVDTSSASELGVAGGELDDVAVLARSSASTRMCTGACGAMSLKAMTRSVSSTIVAGISRAMMRVKMLGSAMVPSLSRGRGARAGLRRTAHQRPRRAFSTARAAGPAVEVRSTDAPSRTASGAGGAQRLELGRGDAALRADDEHDVGVGRAASLDSRSISVRASVAVGSSSSIRADAASVASCFVVDELGAPRSPTARIDCLVASRTMVAQRSRPFAAFAASQREIEREAAHGMTASTPSSVAACTASSSRSPLASACTSTRRGEAASTRCTRSAEIVSSPGAAVVTSPVTMSPRPLPIDERLADPRATDRDGVPRLGARDGHGVADGVGLEVVTQVERAHRRPRSAEEAVAQLGEQALLEVGQRRLRRLVRLRELRDELALLAAQLRRRDDLHADLEVAAAVAAKLRDAAVA